MYLSWLKLIATVITHPFISYFSHRPSAVVRNNAGSLTKALDLMLLIGRVQREIQCYCLYRFLRVETPNQIV